MKTRDLILELAKDDPDGDIRVAHIIVIEPSGREVHHTFSTGGQHMTTTVPTEREGS